MEPDTVLTPIAIISHIKRYKLDRERITQIVDIVCHRLGLEHFEVCIQFVSSKSMRELNHLYRNKDSSTDVLAFPQMSWKRALKTTTKKSNVRPKLLNPQPLGDVVISLADAESNAKGVGSSVDRETCFLLVHGILHLAGHDHMKPREKTIMFTEQRKLMAYFDRKSFWKNCVQRSVTIQKGSSRGRSR
jgi:probable rRNA maturation factor